MRCWRPAGRLLALYDGSTAVCAARGAAELATHLPIRLVPALTARKRMSVVVVAGQTHASDRGAQALAASLREAGVGILYLGREASARRIAACAAESCADAVEVCVIGGGVVALLRDLLRELKRLDRSRVSIVVHRVQ